MSARHPRLTGVVTRRQMRGFMGVLIAGSWFWGAVIALWCLL